MTGSLNPKIVGILHYRVAVVLAARKLLGHEIFRPAAVTLSSRLSHIGRGVELIKVRAIPQ